MKLIKGLIPVIIYLLLFHSVTFHAHSQQTTSPALDRLLKKFENNFILTSQFNHQIIDSFTGDTTLNNGKLWLAENAYKVVTSHSRLLVKDSTSKVYDTLKNRVIISAYHPEDDDFAPSQLLRDINSRYDTIKQSSSGKFTTIKLISRDIFSTFQYVTILLNNEGVPVKISALDQSDNQITTVLNDPHFIPYNPTYFSIDAPENAEIIDLQ